uniref:Uncharacterized protein n=1 Tax=Chromera velia CCMP2878 TaxID=1169474 RepID=A0A0G4FX37_9ALVE|eukprot:Cvel_19061.t1-p1 / transcript=Cvel_19061.t1 / gene=Cvel_19061 / organism=Chromera_velia_CCMP2878 / gene_product=hypothetical protein / transcript_product=hypothetical protein / location=Cvel_scaffold1617:8913-9785(-) / protein_length=291 / sequence_SO=supercontig / SO=protein_coding / is_pseudo=false
MPVLSVLLAVFLASGAVSSAGDGLSALKVDNTESPPPLPHITSPATSASKTSSWIETHLAEIAVEVNRQFEHPEEHPYDLLEMCASAKRLEEPWKNYPCDGTEPLPSLSEAVQYVRGIFLPINESFPVVFSHFSRETGETAFEVFPETPYGGDMPSVDFRKEPVGILDAEKIVKANFGKACVSRVIFRWPLLPCTTEPVYILDVFPECVDGDGKGERRAQGQILASRREASEAGRQQKRAKSEEGVGEDFGSSSRLYVGTRTGNLCRTSVTRKTDMHPMCESDPMWMPDCL